jgi:glycine dehydrogenase subunit 2
MTEPTETESKETLDRFVSVLHEIVEKGKADPAFLHDAPAEMPVRRLDETGAARHMVLTDDM